MGTTTSKRYSATELALENSENIFSKSISYLEGKGDGSADKSTPSKRYLSKKSKPTGAQSETDLSPLHKSVKHRTKRAARKRNNTLDRQQVSTRGDIKEKEDAGYASSPDWMSGHTYDKPHPDDTSHGKSITRAQSLSPARGKGDDPEDKSTPLKRFWQKKSKPKRAQSESDLKYLQESTRTEKVAENSYSILDRQQDLTRGDVEVVHKEDAELDSLRDPKSDQTYEKLYPDDTLCGKSLTGAQSLLPTRDIGEASNTTASERKNIPVTKPKVSKRCDIKSQLIEVLDANGIVSFQIMHKPGTDNQIEIIGTGVERLNEELSIVATHEGYVVVTKNVEFDSDTNGTTNWIHLCSGPIARGTFALARPDLDQRISVIDAIMQGKDKKRRQIKIEYFGMTVAHAFLTKEHNETLMSSTEHFTKVCNEAITNACQIDYYMSAQGYPDIDIAGSPRLLYKYWMPRHVDHDWAVMQDIVFFKVDNDQIRSLDLIGSPNIDVTKSGQQQKNNAKAFITSILSQDDLNEYVGRRIHCAGKSGTLISQPYTRHEGCTLGHHLVFTLDKNERLKGGDCGSFLCLEEEKDSGRLDILGMFIGQFKTDRCIHQAVILSWNIRQVEETEELKISDIKLAEADLDNDSDFP